MKIIIFVMILLGRLIHFVVYSFTLIIMSIILFLYFKIFSLQIGPLV